MILLLVVPGYSFLIFLFLHKKLMFDRKKETPAFFPLNILINVQCHIHKKSSVEADRIAVVLLFTQCNAAICHRVLC